MDETFDVGEDTGTPVIEDYAERMPLKFTGRIEKIVINLAPGREGTPPPEAQPARTAGEKQAQ